MLIRPVIDFHPVFDKFCRFYLFGGLLIFGIVSADFTVVVSVAQRDGRCLTGVAIEPLALDLNVGQPVLDLRAQMDVTPGVEWLAVERTFGAATRHLRSFHALIARIVVTPRKADAVIQKHLTDATLGTDRHVKTVGCGGDEQQIPTHCRNEPKLRSLLLTFKLNDLV